MERFLFNTCARGLWGLLIVSTAILAVSFLPIVSLQSVLARWGEDATITEPVMARVVFAARAVGVAGLIVTGCLLWLLPHWTGKVDLLASVAFKEAREFLAGFLRDLRKERLLFFGLAFIMLLGFWVRWHYLWRPIQCDESFTFFLFASRPWYLALSKYAPNNHILHTLLVNRCLVLGNSLPILRLPAFLAGLCIVPSVFFLGRRLYSKEAGLIGASLVSASAPMVDYSTDARGYSLLVLFSVLSWINAISVLRRPGIWAWTGLVLFPALGFWTVPVMLYPYTALLLWLILSAAAGDAVMGFARLLRGVCIAAFCTVAITLLLYSPVFLVSGVKSVTANPYVLPVEWGRFIHGLPGQVVHVGRYFTLGYPAVLTGALCVGMLATALWPRQASSLQISPLYPLVLATGGWLLVQRRIPDGGLGRAWLFLVPFGLVLASGGWAAGIRRVLVATGPWAKRGMCLAACFLALWLGLRVMALGWITSLTVLPQPSHYEDEEVTRYLKTRIRPGDCFLLNEVLSAWTFHYHFLRQGLPMEALEWDPERRGDLYVLRKHSGLLSSRLDDILATVSNRYDEPEHLQDFPYSSLFRMRRKEQAPDNP